MNKATLFKTLPFVFILASCAVTPGMKEADVPPKIVKVDNQVSWNDPSAFGPVPQDKAASGNTICQSMGFASATGYHRNAQDINGKPFPNGGYFCEGKSDKAALTFPPSIAAPVAAAAAPSAMPLNSAASSAPQAMPPAKTQATDSKKKKAKKKKTTKTNTAKPASPGPTAAPGASPTVTPSTSKP